MENNDMTFENRVRDASRAALEDLGLSNTVKVTDARRDIESSRVSVDLTEQTGPTEFSYHSFYLDSVEASNAAGGGYMTLEILKPLALREILKIFPESAIH
ncbi:MAG TPA: hypothetical protein VKC61_10725 [Pyrinomonadaceae bacterium]|nr:hypothetical protein [Pyrinomonadaceae bacterium]